MAIYGDLLTDFFGGLDNKFTGNLDFARQRDLQLIAQDFNASQAQIDRDFQEKMAGTQYQRAVADIQAAGLNPMMIYGGGGSQNAAPSGSAASSGIGHAGTSGSGWNALINVAGQITATAAAIGMKKLATDIAYRNVAKTLAKSLVPI